MNHLLSLILILLTMNVFAMGDTSKLTRDSNRMTRTIRTLNQVEREEDPHPPPYESVEERKFSTQDIQESLYREDLKREKKQWEESKVKRKGMK